MCVRNLKRVSQSSMGIYYWCVCRNSRVSCLGYVCVLVKLSTRKSTGLWVVYYRGFHISTIVMGASIRQLQNYATLACVWTRSTTLMWYIAIQVHRQKLTDFGFAFSLCMYAAFLQQLSVRQQRTDSCCKPCYGYPAGVRANACIYTLSC